MKRPLWFLFFLASLDLFCFFQILLGCLLEKKKEPPKNEPWWERTDLTYWLEGFDLRTVLL